MNLEILVIRHGATDWSIAKRLQGRRDLGLSDEGRSQVLSWRLPEVWQGSDCYASPLRRARETAELMQFQPAIEPLLIETDWGEFEGKTLAELRADPTNQMAGREALGLDFKPPSGESPRQVANRIAQLLAQKEPSGREVWFTHKGVRNACLTLTTGWQMTSKPPLKLADDEALWLRIGPNAQPRIVGTLPMLPS